VAPQLLAAGLRVVDLSADYRFADAARYEQAYARTHADRGNLAGAVYGLTEFCRKKVAGAALVANPGCYPTGAALAIVPLIARDLASPGRIIVNAATGATGAGRTPTENLHFPEQNESYYPYGTIGGHRHQPEIEIALTGITGRPTGVLFVPHLLPIDQGILETIYLEPAGPHVKEDDLFEALESAYAEEPFVRVTTELPNVKHVRDTNFCDLTVRLAGGRIVVFAALDNLIKGASGQAVQNMNVMFGQEETAGLL
jgi:N-acetyl-gamma-glutamyl-phosphate reductase